MLNQEFFNYNLVLTIRCLAIEQVKKTLPTST